MSIATRPSDADAVAYVVDHFATRDYDMTILCTGAGESKQGAECTDVHFVDAREDDGPTYIMTVWHEPAKGGALYGEW